MVLRGGNLSSSRDVFLQKRRLVLHGFNPALDCHGKGVAETGLGYPVHALVAVQKNGGWVVHARGEGRDLIVSSLARRFLFSCFGWFFILLYLHETHFYC